MSRETKHPQRCRLSRAELFSGVRREYLETCRSNQFSRNPPYHCQRIRPLTTRGNRTRRTITRFDPVVSNDHSDRHKCKACTGGCKANDVRHYLAEKCPRCTVGPQLGIKPESVQAGPLEEQGPGDPPAPLKPDLFRATETPPLTRAASGKTLPRRKVVQQQCVHRGALRP